MNREMAIDYLINTAECCWEEKDRPTLSAMPIATLKALYKEATETAVQNAAQAGAKELETKTEHVVNAQTPQTDEEWLKQHPAIAEDVTYARKVRNDKKAELINKIVANVATDQQDAHRSRLAKRTIDDLEQDLAIMPTPATKPDPNYIGAIGAPITNAKFDKDDILPIPD